MPAVKSCLWFHADAVSFVVPCESQADVDRYSDALVRGGEEGQCGWLEDCSASRGRSCRTSSARCSATPIRRRPVG